MREFIVNGWEGVMNMNRNPLRHIPDMQVRHLILQILAWMWCITFSLFFSSWYVFGITVVGHFVLILAIVVTVITFTASERTYRFKEGYHSHGRARDYVMYRDNNGNPYKVKLPNNDPGGEHE
jgi:hypothetical protein|tara:strand:+ start:317 stop:685 length:369 start_codon:yes stop_codon:yes gene_type:complete